MSRSAVRAAAQPRQAADALPLAAVSLATLGLGAWLAAAQLLPGPIDIAKPIGAGALVMRERVAEAVSSALGRYDAARRSRDDAAARAALLEARSGLRSLLAATPAHPLRWALLAEVEQRLGAPFRQVEALLDQSRAMGALEFPAVTRRVQLALRLWPALSADAKAAADRDLGTLLALEPKHGALIFLVQTAALLPADRMAIAARAVERHAPQSMKSFQSYRKHPPEKPYLP